MLGEKMKELRLSKNLTLEELASKLNECYPETVNFNKGKLSKWENGKEEPKLSSMRILADFYNTSIDSFYDDNIEGDQLTMIVQELEDHGIKVESNEEKGTLTLYDNEFTYTVPLSSIKQKKNNERIQPKFLQELEKDKLIANLTGEKTFLFKISELAEQLSPKYQEKVYNYTKNQLDDQESSRLARISFNRKNKEEIIDLAAHSEIDGRVYSKEEIKGIMEYLDQFVDE